jgi:hypothetical protein
MRSRFSGRLGSSGWLILGGDFAVLQAPVFEGLPFDAPTFLKDLPASSEVDIRYIYLSKKSPLALGLGALLICIPIRNR